MNIIFNSIEIEGFMSLGHVNIDLKDSGYTLINGVNNTETDLAKSNGSGKSSIWEALVWCLTGETIRGTKSVENIIQNNGTYVKLNFTVNNDNYVIIRSKNHKQYKTNLLVYVNDKDVSGKGVRDTTKILKEYLPELDNSIISSVIVLGQGLPSRFTNNSPSGRKEVLEQLSKSDFMVEDIKLRIINRKSELDKELRQEQDTQLKTKSECELLQTQLDSDIEQLNSEQDVEQTKQLLIISKEQCNTLQNLVTEIQTECEQINTQINENSLTISSLESQKNEQINDLQQKYYNIINPLNIKQTEILKDVQFLQNEITNIENIKDVCPTCGQKLPNIFKPDVSDKKIKLDNLLQQKHTVEQELTNQNLNLQTEISQVTEDISQQINNLQQLNLTLKQKYSEVNNKLVLTNKELTNITKQISEYENVINSYETTKQLLEQRVFLSQNKITNYKSQLQEIEQDILDIENHLNVIKKFDTIIKRDFRGYLLHNVIEYINTVAKQYCSQVFNTDLIEFKLDGNNISISYNNKEYEMLSGGEKQKIDLIVQFSIRDMLCKYLNFSCNILVLDEIFDNIDSVGCDKVIELISNKLQEVSSVYIISHHAEELEIPVDNYITVVKGLDGVSYVK